MHFDFPLNEFPILTLLPVQKDGTTIETSTAAALLAATYSGGDSKIGENIAQLLVPEMGENVDQNMMAALMSSGSMIQVSSDQRIKLF